MNDGDITGNATLKAQVTNIINNFAYNGAIAEILRNEGTYQWDDFNNTNSKLPFSTSNLTVTAGSEVSEYALPTAASNTRSGSSDASSFLRLWEVYVKDAAGYYRGLQPIDDSASSTPLETVFSTPGMPSHYKLIGTSIKLFPAPLASAVTATNGLKFVFQTDKIDFVVGDTTKQPGFPSIYHPLIPIETAEIYCGIKGMKQTNFLSVFKAKFYRDLGWGIANRNKDLPQRITSAQSRRNNNYE